MNWGEGVGQSRERYSYLGEWRGAFHISIKVFFLKKKESCLLLAVSLLRDIYDEHKILHAEISANCRYNTLPEVSVRMVTERHLVGSSPERDLLPMVLTHCNYSLMVGQAATLDYDFAAFQQQLQDTLLQCKARVQRSPLGHIPVSSA